MVAGSGLKIYDTMKYSLLFFAALCFATRAADAQVIVRSKEDPSKILTLGERMTPQTAWNRFGIRPVKAYDDDLFDCFIEKYEYDNGNLEFDSFNSIASEFAIYSDRYTLIIDRKFFISVGMTIAELKRRIPADEMIIKRLTDNLFAVWFKITGTEIFADDRLMLEVDAQERILAMGWIIPD